MKDSRLAKNPKLSVALSIFILIVIIGAALWLWLRPKSVLTQLSPDLPKVLEMRDGPELVSDAPELKGLAFPDMREPLQKIAAHVNKDNYPLIMSYDTGYRDVKRHLDQYPLEMVGYLQGVLDALQGKDTFISEDQLRDLEAHYFFEVKNHLLYTRAVRQWEKIKALKDIHESKYGYLYEELHGPEGTLSKEFGPNDFVAYFKRSYLLTGKLLSEKLTAPPIVEQVKNTYVDAIPLSEMAPGEIRRIFLPYPLAYGQTGSIEVPPYSVVVLEIQAVDRVSAPKDYLPRGVPANLQPLDNDMLSNFMAVGNSYVLRKASQSQ